MTGFWKAVLVVLALAGGVFFYNKYQDAVAQVAVAELHLKQEITLREGTEARLAGTTLLKDSLQEAVKTAEQLNGTLLAALRIRVPARDTVITHVLVPDSLTVDSTRYASFHDSTFAGTIDGQVKAPPCCAPLEVGYTLFRPSFSPTVALVRVKDSVAVSVTWNGEKVDIVAPFANIPVPPRRFGYWGEVLYDTKKNWIARGGVLVRMPKHFEGIAGISTDRTAFVGVRKEH